MLIAIAKLTEDAYIMSVLALRPKLGISLAGFLQGRVWVTDAMAYFSAYVGPMALFAMAYHEM